MKYSALYILVVFFIITQYSCKITTSKSSSNYSFNCNDYNYFANKKIEKVHDYVAPSLLKYYAKKYKNCDCLDKNGDTIKEALLSCYYNLCTNKIDSSWYNFLLSKAGKNYHFKSLDYIQVLNSIATEVLIWGTVISKKSVYDPNKCLRFKTEYVIKVDEFFHANFKLKEGDYLLAKDIMGYDAGCDTKLDSSYTSYSHSYEFKIGETGYFNLSKYDSYESKLYYDYLRKKNNTQIFEDVYCPNSFAIPLAIDETNEILYNKREDLRAFFKTSFLQHNFNSVE